MTSKSHPVDRQQLVSLYREALSTGVPLAQLDQKITRLTNRLTVTDQFEAEATDSRVSSIKKQLPLWVKLGAFAVPVTFLTVGAILVANAVLPLMNYYTQSLASEQTANLVSPIPPEDLIDVAPTVISQLGTGYATAYDDQSQPGVERPTFIDAQLDYTNLANWFDEAQVAALTAGETSEAEYVIDIPKLNISNARVKIGGTDLDNGLIQYPGTAEPGKPGAPVIFGHSVLRQFYNPHENNPRRYISIFSTIMTLKPGDEIYVTFDGAKYKYVMKEKTEVKPEDVYILMQNYDGRTLKLVTCTPEGTHLRRGVVTAELVTPE